MGLPNLPTWSEVGARLVVGRWGSPVLRPGRSEDGAQHIHPAKMDIRANVMFGQYVHCFPVVLFSSFFNLLFGYSTLRYLQRAYFPVIISHCMEHHLQVIFTHEQQVHLRTSGLAYHSFLAGPFHKL